MKGVREYDLSPEVNMNIPDQKEARFPAETTHYLKKM